MITVLRQIIQKNVLKTVDGSLLIILYKLIKIISSRTQNHNIIGIIIQLTVFSS